MFKIPSAGETASSKVVKDSINATGNNLVSGFFGEGNSGVFRREVIRWQVPSKQFHIEMYINPQNITIQSSKLINEVRTKGGFIIQYWGENFDTASIAGMTGSGGIEGINILKSIYRDEQLEIDGVLKTIISTIQNMNTTQIAQAAGLGISEGASALYNFATNGNSQAAAALKSLAARAANVKMFYQGVTYRGFFKTFNSTETADQLGLFNYDMAFTIVETIGKRSNYMPWHRKASVPAPGPVTYSRITQSPDSILQDKLRGLVTDTRSRTSR